MTPIECKSPTKITSLFAVFFLSLLVGSINPVSVDAQIYTPVSQSSQYQCVSMPNGRARAAILDGDTYRHMSFKRANNLIQRDIRGLRNRIQNINRILRRLNKQRRRGLSTGQLTERTLQRIYRFMVEGEVQGDFPEAIDLQIQALQDLRSNFRDRINFKRLERRLVRQCKRRKYFPVEIEVYSFVTSTTAGYQGQPAGNLRTSFIARAPNSMFTSLQPSSFLDLSLSKWVCLDIPGRSLPTSAIFDAFPCHRTTMATSPAHLRQSCNAYVASRNHQGNATHIGAILGELPSSLPKRDSSFGTHVNSRTMEEVRQDHEVALRDGPYATLFSAKAAAPRRAQSVDDCNKVRF